MTIENSIHGNRAKGIKEQLDENNRQIKENAKQIEKFREEVRDNFAKLNNAISKIENKQSYFFGKVAGGAAVVSVIVGLIMNYILNRL